MTDTPTPTPPSPALDAANTERALAEARLFDAQADKAQSEANKHQAEAREADAKARVADLEATKKERERREADAADVNHHVYRFNGSVDASSVDKAITKLTEWHRLADEPLTMEIVFFSPGGGVIPGFALFDHLRGLSAEGHTIVTGCTGMAASMGGILVQAGDHRWMTGEAWYMIHRAAFGASGKTFEIEDEVEWVKRIEKRIIEIFVSRSDLTAQKIKRNWDRKDWWIDSDEALDLGLVDEIRGVAINSETA
jgi:ATP-dependent Clp endopeptidase proteolytic subunit ClpP